MTGLEHDLPISVNGSVILPFRVGSIESKEEGKDQKSIQSSTTSDLRHHMGK